MNKLLSIRLTHLSFILISGFLLIIAVVGVSMFGIYSAAEEVRIASSNSVKILTAGGKIAEASDYLTDQARFYAVKGDIEHYNAYWKEVNETQTREKAITELTKLGIPTEILDIAENAKQKSDNLIKLEMESFENVKQGNMAKAAELVLGNEYSVAKQVIVDKLVEFEVANMAFIETRIRETSEKLETILFGACVIIAITAVVFIAFLVTLLKGLTASISQLSSLFIQIADGDMTVTAPIKEGNSEIFEMYRSTNVFVKNIKNILTNAITASEEVASGSNQLAATMEELSSTFVTQSQQVQDTVSSMETMNDTVKNSVMKLGDNENIIDQTAEKAHEGRTQLMNLKTSMENIHVQADSLSETIGKLSISSAEIGNIINVINDIADQTNLLALNAAIEAARAGDAGRGFAVVADEVRKLAERTQKATGEVTSIIMTLQRESEAASVEMDNASQKVTEGVQQIETTGALFNNIFSEVESVKNATGEISDDMTHEYELIQSINENTRSFASGIEESSSAVTEVTSTVAHLQERVNNLKNMIARFKVK